MTEEIKNHRLSDGRFTEGNRFWHARATHGRPPLFNDSDSLWQACCEYFEWVVQNPLKEEKIFARHGNIARAEVSKMRAMTITGLCNFLEITRETWINWRNNRSDFSDVISRVESFIWCQKFEGAAAGLLNANIISRELGLADKQEHSGLGGKPHKTKPEPMSDFEVARRLAFLLTRGVKAKEELDQKGADGGPANQG